MTGYWQGLVRSEAGGWWPDLLLLLAISALVLLPGLGQTKHLASREIRHAEIIREMAESGQYCVPRLLGQDYFDKPAIMHAPAAWLTRLTGQPSLGLARLPSALCAALATLAVYALGRKLHRRLVGAFAAVALLAMPGFHSMARQARPDMILACSVVASCLAALWGLAARRQGTKHLAFLLAGMLAGLGTLAKGPFGVLFPLLFCLIIPFRDQRWRPMRWGILAWSIGLFLTLLAWAIPAYCYDQGAYLRSVIHQPDLDATASTSRNWLKQLTYYLRNGIVPSLPVILFVPLALRNRAFPRPLAVAASIFCVLTATPKQRKHYLLPALPFLALGIVPSILERAKTQLWVRRAALILFPAFLIGQALFYSLALPLLHPADDPELAFSRQALEKVEQGGIILCTEGHEALAWTARSTEGILPIGEDTDPRIALATMPARQPAYLITDAKSWKGFTEKAPLPHQELCRVAMSDNVRLLLRINPGGAGGTHSAPSKASS